MSTMLYRLTVASLALVMGILNGLAGNNGWMATGMILFVLNVWAAAVGDEV